jgi:hypothetical protein
LGRDRLNLSERAESAAVFNRIAFCYECDNSARRPDSGARGRRAGWLIGRRAILLFRAQAKPSFGRRIEERLVSPGGGSLG